MGLTTDPEIEVMGDFVTAPTPIGDPIEPLVLGLPSGARQTDSVEGAPPRHQRVRLPVFKGRTTEDPDSHLAQFEQYLRANREQNDGACLELFPSSLDGAAFTWYTQFPDDQFSKWGDLSRAFLEHYRKAKEEADLYSVLQNMTQRRTEPVEGYIGRMRVIMRRLTVKPSHGQRISWMRRAVRNSLIKIVEQTPTSDADEYEKRLIQLESTTKMLKIEPLEEDDGGGRRGLR